MKSKIGLRLGLKLIKHFFSLFFQHLNNVDKTIDTLGSGRAY